MADYDYLPVSSGSGDSPLMHIQAIRSPGGTVITVDTTTNVPQKFIGTYGTIASNNLIDPATKVDFKGHLNSGNVIIDSIEPGFVDNGNTASQVIIIKPNTGWANRVASLIKNATGFGTPENLFAAVMNAASAILSGDITVGGNAHITGNLDITGTSRLISASVASASTITPTKQIYNVTALAATASVAVPSFTPNDGMSLLIKIRDNGTARALSFASGYTNVSGLDTPTTTVANKLLTIGAIYDSATSKWQIQGINQEA